MVTEHVLLQKINKIKKFFNIEKLLSLSIDDEYIARYYKVNKLAYSIFHTFSDRMYIGISRDGVYKKEDLLEAALTTQKYILSLKAKHVLELATGRGATSAYLAEKFPNVQFDGLDISQGQLDFAYKKANKYKNYSPATGNYHDLSRFPNNYFDVVFVIEALCYSQQKEKVLMEVYRVLRKNGVFIILDGYAKKEESKLTKNELLAKKLTERGMAVAKFETYTSFLAKIKKTKFQIISNEDVTEFIFPFLKRMEGLAMKFFALPPILSIFIIKIFPPEFTYNIISGFLMPCVFYLQIYTYRIIILEK